VKIGNGLNKFGTPISIHICEFCGVEFTVCPAVPPEKEDQWLGCLAPSCSSYDPSRDVDKMIDEGTVLVVSTDKLN